MSDIVDFVPESLIQPAEPEPTHGYNLASSFWLDPPSFPPEILSEIFLAFGPAQITTVQLNPNLYIPAMVCKTWRSVALSTPAIWAEIIIDFQGLTAFDYLEKPHWNAKAIEQYLKLSGNHVLDIRLLHYPSEHMKKRWKVFHCLSTILEIGINRTERLIIRISARDFVDKVYLALSRAARLKELELGSAVINIFPTNTLEDAESTISLPSLRSLLLTKMDRRPLARISGPNVQTLKLIHLRLTFSFLESLNLLMPRLSKLILGYNDVKLSEQTLKNHNTLRHSFRNLRQLVVAEHVPLFPNEYPIQPTFVLLSALPPLLTYSFTFTTRNQIEAYFSTFLQPDVDFSQMTVFELKFVRNSRPRDWSAEIDHGFDPLKFGSFLEKASCLEELRLSWRSPKKPIPSWYTACTMTSSEIFEPFMKYLSTPLSVGGLDQTYYCPQLRRIRLVWFKVSEEMIEKMKRRGVEIVYEENDEETGEY